MGAEGLCAATFENPGQGTSVKGKEDTQRKMQNRFLLESEGPRCASVSFVVGGDYVIV